MSQKYWEVLLTEWRKRGNQGFSIPFIIGSQQYLLDTTTRDDISNLLCDIAKNENIQIYITYCTDINDLILGVRDESKMKIAGKHLRFENGVVTSLFLTKIAYNLGDSLGEVIDSLIERYQHYINEKKYSINDGERGMFSLSEREFIEKCFTTEF